MEYSKEFKLAESMLLEIHDGVFEESWQIDAAFENIDHYALMSIARSLEKISWKEIN